MPEDLTQCQNYRDNLKLVFVLFSYRYFHQMIGLRLVAVVLPQAVVVVLPVPVELEHKD